MAAVLRLVRFISSINLASLMGLVSWAFDDDMLRAMNAKAVTLILNASDMAASFAWFAKWGWQKLWDWGTPPTFGAVGCGEVEIFLCHGARGGRGKGTNTTTFQKDGDEAGDKGRVDVVVGG